MQRPRLCGSGDDGANVHPAKVRPGQSQQQTSMWAPGTEVKTTPAVWCLQRIRRVAGTEVNIASTVWRPPRIKRMAGTEVKTVSTVWPTQRIMTERVSSKIRKESPEGSVMPPWRILLRSGENTTCLAISTRAPFACSSGHLHQASMHTNS